MVSRLGSSSWVSRPATLSQYASPCSCACLNCVCERPAGRGRQGPALPRPRAPASFVRAPPDPLPVPLPAPSPSLPDAGSSGLVGSGAGGVGWSVSPSSVLTASPTLTLLPPFSGTGSRSMSKRARNCASSIPCFFRNATAPGSTSYSRASASLSWGLKTSFDWRNGFAVQPSASNETNSGRCSSPRSSGTQGLFLRVLTNAA